jgi:signal peptidase I
MTEASSKYRIWIYLFVGIGLVLAALFGYEFIYRYPIWTLHAFSVPSSSMCPTICNGERVLAEMRGELPYAPRRGEVILFDNGRDPAKFVKRVIGVPGDIVAPGPNGTILVNGRSWQGPPICAKSLLPTATNPDISLYSAFKETVVMPGHVFVIGDNLYNSFDSRIPQFEPVTFDKVRGRPVMIYWSPDSSRIGCAIQ